MISLIFILFVNAHEQCRVPLTDTGMGQMCEGGNFKWFNTYIVNSKPCYDKGMNQEISEQQLKTYKKTYQVIEDPKGGISYCPQKSRYKKYEGK